MSMSSGQASSGSRHRHTSSQHHVVPIGGAPFVPPYLTMLQDDASLRKDDFAAQQAPISAGGASPQSPTSSLGSSSASSSPSRSPYSSSPPMSESMSSPGYEAAVRYSSAMLTHTQRMWERERSTIERTRLEGSSKTGFESDKSKTQASSSASPTSNASSSTQQQQQQQQSSEPRRGSFASDALDVILRRRTIGAGNSRNGRRHQKTSSIV